MADDDKGILSKLTAGYANSGVGHLLAKTAVAWAGFFGGDAAKAHELAGAEHAKKGETGAGLSEEWKAEKEILAHVGSKLGIGGHEADHSCAALTPPTVASATTTTKTRTRVR